MHCCFRSFHGICSQQESIDSRLILSSVRMYVNPFCWSVPLVECVGYRRLWLVLVILQHNCDVPLTPESSVKIVPATIIGSPSLIYICLSNCCPFQSAANEIQIIRCSICHLFPCFLWDMHKKHCEKTLMTKYSKLILLLLLPPLCYLLVALGFSSSNHGSRHPSALSLQTVIFSFYLYFKMQL